MSIYAVIDTNILVSSMLSRHPDSATRRVVDAVSDGTIIPMINFEILSEYQGVLGRAKFKFSSEDVSDLLEIFSVKAESYIPEVGISDFVDEDDYIFYVTYKLREDSYLVTGNLRHFPKESRIVSPVDMVHILELIERSDIISEPRGEYISELNKNRLRKAQAAMERMRQSAVAGGISDMSMEEIDEEIRLVRAGKRR